jgi:hypothetical protein
MRHDHAKDVRNLLIDARKLARSLGWDKRMKPNGRGVLVCCPAHGEHDPSCGITPGSDGTLRARCFACGWTADVFGMLALAHGLSTRSDFGELIAIGAELGGRLDIAEEVRGKRQDRSEKRALAPVPTPIAEPERDYPDRDAVAKFWTLCGPVGSNGAAVKMLMGRGIRFDLVDDINLARSVRVGQPLPPGCLYRTRSWVETGHTLILPAWDATGALRSFRGWRVTDGDSPKRLPPTGFRQSGLVLANRLAVLMLRRWVCPRRLWVVEGEPDYLQAATEFGMTDAVIGVGSGSWTEEFAAAVPPKTKVMVYTHNDPAGDKYAANVIESLGEDRNVWRWRPAA